jgi:hypothetical protein
MVSEVLSLWGARRKIAPRGPQESLQGVPASSKLGCPCVPRAIRQIYDRLRRRKRDGPENSLALFAGVADSKQLEIAHPYRRNFVGSVLRSREPCNSRFNFVPHPLVKRCGGSQYTVLLEWLVLRKDLRPLLSKLHQETFCILFYGI